MPQTVSRAEWGALPATRAYTPRGRGNARLVVHHTAGDFIAAEDGRPGPKWYARLAEGRASLKVKAAIRAFEREKANVEAKERAAMRAIQTAHRARGFIDIGYHEVGFPSGRLYDGRPLNVQGAHCLGANDELGFSFAGNYEKDTPTDKALASFRAWCAEVGVETMRGHYRVPGNATACPGRSLKAALDL